MWQTILRANSEIQPLTAALRTKSKPPFSFEKMGYMGGVLSIPFFRKHGGMGACRRVYFCVSITM